MQPILGNDTYEKFSENGKIGLRNITTDQVVIEAIYDDLGWSKGGLETPHGLIGLKQNERWALANIDGSKITSHLFSELYPFTDNAFVVGMRSRFSILNDYGAINAKGNEIIPTEYQWIEPIGDALIVSKKKGNQSHFGLLNKNGNSLLPLEFNHIERINNQTLSVQNDQRLYALYTLKGKALSDFLYELILRYDENTFKVKYYNKEGLIDRKGTLIIPPEYKSLNLRNGKAEVLPFNKWTVFTLESSPKTFAHDDIWLINKDLVAIQTNGNIGIVNISNKNTFDHYVQKMQITHTQAELLAVKKNGFEGVINAEGETILSPQFDSVQFFKSVIFAKSQRKDNQNWIPYDLTGKRIGIQFYEKITQKEDGSFLPQRNGKYGLLDAEGYEQSPFIFDKIYDFENGLTVAEYQENQGVIKDNGNWLITPYKDSIQIIGKRIFYQQGTEYGVYDLFEQQIFRSINPVTPYQNAFSELTDDGYKLYDFDANELSPNTYDSVYQISPDFLVLKSKSKFQLLQISAAQTFKLDSKTQQVRGHREGLISVMMENEWGFVSEQGLLTIANRYQQAKDFSQGLSAIRINGNWGFINTDDQITIQPTFQSVESFINGLSTVKINDLYGLIDLNGVFVLNAVYNQLTRKQGFILLEKDKQFGLANHEGVLVRTPQFDSMTTTDNINFIVSRNGKYGVVDIEGRDRVPVSFDVIKQSGDTFLAMEKQAWIELKINK
ncbi:WG repeat-containing protein [Roseivirga sp.]|uniref:WG repeat-containing protein n=1 Tax=Roseivirga sp. TaxID=1964215 RepID=UPI002B26EBDF|nr:WG repeat-containing protein [Roseivirga sp.]